MVPPREREREGSFAMVEKCSSERDEVKTKRMGEMSKVGRERHGRNDFFFVFSFFNLAPVKCILPPFNMPYVT